MDILKDEESMRRFLEVIESGDPIKDFYDEDDLASALATVVEDRLSRPGGKIRLRILAYHLAVICNMKVGESSTLYPVEGGPQIAVDRTSESRYRIAGIPVGNIWGATAKFASIVHDVVDGIHPDNDSSRAGEMK